MRPSFVLSAQPETIFCSPLFRSQVILKEYDFAPKPGHDPGMTTGATIHTKNGLYMNVTRRQKGSSSAGTQPAAAAAVGAA